LSGNTFVADRSARGNAVVRSATAAAKDWSGKPDPARSAGVCAQYLLNCKLPKHGVETFIITYYYMCMKLVRAFLILLLPFTFSACKASGVSNLFNEPYKKIMIADADPNYPVQINELTGNYIMLVLYDAKRDPSFDNIDETELMTYPFALGKIENGVIDVKLSEMLTYWTGEGNYWIMFFLPDGRGEKISNGYISKEPHYIHKDISYFNNKDFMLPVLLNLDLSGTLPF
jgi:hypothetical protein